MALEQISKKFPNRLLDGRFFVVKAQKMSRIKKAISAALATAFVSVPVQADDGLAEFFSGCAGRFSAELEHAWLLGASDAEQIRARREAFLTLLEATVDPERTSALLNYRVETKQAHASLLTLATFGADAQRAGTARNLAQFHLNTCNRILLGA